MFQESPYVPGSDGDGEGAVAVADAQVQELERLKKEGRLTAADVLEEAADESSPLHDLFEWDDSKAAAAYRLEQARGVVRKFQIIVSYEDKQVAAPRYVHRSDEERTAGYVSTADLRRDPVAAEAAAKRELRAACGHVRRAELVAVAVGLTERARRIRRVLERLARDC